MTFGMHILSICVYLYACVAFDVYVMRTFSPLVSSMIVIFFVLRILNRGDGSTLVTEIITEFVVGMHLVLVFSLNEHNVSSEIVFSLLMKTLRSTVFLHANIKNATNLLDTCIRVNNRLFYILGYVHMRVFPTTFTLATDVPKCGGSEEITHVS